MGTAPSSFSELVGILIDFIGLLVPLIFALTILFLSWGIIQAWIINGGDAKSVESGKKIAFVGVVALVFMIGIWAIVEILQNSLGF
jgi:hypothetical protein